MKNISTVNPAFIAIAAALLSRRLIMNLDSSNSVLGYLKFFAVSLFMSIGWCFLLLILVAGAGSLGIPEKQFGFV